MKKKQWKQLIASLICIAMLVNTIPANAMSSSVDETELLATEEIKSSDDGVEIVEKRESNKKYFRMQDGSILAAIYPQDVHYEDEQGKWCEIDNSLNAGLDGLNAVYENSNNEVGVKFMKKANKNKLFTLVKDDWKFKVSIEDVEKVRGEVIQDDIELSNGNPYKLEDVNGQITYNGIFENTDIQYSMVASQLKENIILHDTVDFEKITYQYQYDKDLNVVQKDEQTIVFKKTESENIVLEISAPVMWDANGECNDALRLTVKETKQGKASITLEWDKEELEGMRYPITIDPVMSFSTNRLEIQDTHILAGYPNQNYNATNHVRVRNNGYTLLQFPTPSLESGDKIIEAQLALYPYGNFDNSLSIYTNENSYNPPLYINAHKILRGWDETTATYNNIAPDNGFYDATVQAHRIVDGDDGYYTWDITRLANEWTEGHSENYGVLLKYDQPPSDGSMFDSFFCSTNGAYISSSAWPQILYQYINTKGIEEYYSYHTQDLGYGGTGYVNDLTGDLTIINPVVQTGGNLAPISVSLVYNLDAYTIQCYGRCWKINWSQKIEKITSGTYTGLKYCDGDGTKHFFEYKSDTNEYVDEVNQNRKLISDGTSGNLKMIDDTGVTLYFTKNGTSDEWYLTKSEDAYGNYIIVELEPTYMPRVNKIYSSTGNVVDFIYGDWSFLSKIRYYDGETARDVSVEYNNYVAVGNNSIGKLTYPDGTYVQYHYSSGDYNITKVIDIDNSYMQYDYTSGNPRRVMGVTEYSTMQEEGQKIAYSYQPTSTYITDVTNNRKYLYTFERTGTLKSVVDVTTNDGNGYGQYYEYNNGNTEQLKGKDKLTFISKTQKSTVNLLRDHSYENGLNIWPHQAWGHKTGTSSGTVVTGTSRLGTKSYRLYRSDDCDAGRTLAYDRIRIELGKRYTFSAYVNTKDMVSYGKGASVYVAGEYFEFESEHITETKNEWQRVSVTFIAPITGYASTCLSMQGAKGYVYYDCVQMEAGDLSEYNLLENAGFEGPSGQTAEGWGSYTGENFIVSNEKSSGNYALRFNGGPNKDNEYQQVIYQNGNEGDTYVLSAFAKATSVPVDGWQYTMLIRFEQWGTRKNTVTIPFNSNTTDWQKVSGVAKAEGAYTAIVICLLYYGNANEVHFDNVQLVEDNFGNSYTYDENGNVISTIDLQGKEEYTFKYDGNNQLIQQTNIAGGRYNYTYNKDKNTELDMVSSGGVSSVFSYDAKGNVTDATTVGSGLIEGKYYYIQGQKLLGYFDVADQNITNGTKIKYDQFDKTQHQRWKLIKNADGTYGLSPESAPNMLLSATNTTLYDYAQVGLYPEGAALHQKLNLTKHFGNIYRIDFATAPGYSIDGNANSCYAYGSHEGEYQQFAFILAENIGTEANPSMTSSATYSENGEYTTSIEDSRGNITNYNYNETRGNLLSAQDAKGTITQYTYDERELLSQVSTVNGDGTSSVGYSYDLYKRLSEIRSSSGNQYVFAYDSFGRNQAIFISTRELVHYAYSNKGLMTAIQYGNGTTVTYDYDELNRQTSTYVNDELRYEYVYDGASRILEVRDSILSARLKYGYDIVGRVVSEKLINSSNLTTKAELNIRYDDSKNRISGYNVTIDSYNKQTDYVYSTDTATPDLVSGVKRNEQNVLTYQYDELLRLKNRTINTTTPYVTNYYYLEGKTSGTTTTLVKRLQNGNDVWEYSYDELGNILSVEKNGEIVASYNYDNLNQLVSEVRGTDTYTYSYDNGGNLIEVTKNGSIIKSYGYEDSEWKDLLTSFNGQTITYDEIGNPLTYRDGMVMTWSDGRKLSTITKGTDSIVYQYDVNGYRRYKIVNGVETEYYWLNGQLEGQKSGTEYLHFLYDEKGTAYGFVLKNETIEDYYYYEFNLQGDIIGIVDNAGTKVVAYSYGAWGDILSITGSMADTIGHKNPLRYRGYYYDVETGFYYVCSRYYDSEIGRWINADSVMGANQDMTTYNLFAYCGNNPVCRYDIGGMFWKELISGILHAANNFAISIGIDTAAIGASFLMMEPDDSGVYHASFDCWQQYAGYNQFYDFAFNLGTSMVAAQFSFSYDGCGYTIWAWKGDYINLGAGAELGIYRGSSGHRTVDTSLAMWMGMIVSYKNEWIIDYFPNEDQWWITGFNPKYQNVNANDLLATIGVGFNSSDMYHAFKRKWGGDTRWSFYDYLELAILQF